MNVTKKENIEKFNIKVNRPDLGSNAFQLASHVVEGSSTFLDLSLLTESAVLQFFLRW